ncbi:MAG: tetratricopeptide repeat protein [Desulfitobacteriaceae bacterium]|nr:tetratricopeptide repeat protein [Desulfitobacteriaceae bacterium]MDI6877816.1 tetratricopeptide repeat protein [Desulfitobacteriaceae bacterium]MDI6912845.1 tetratricopeptide repeat protein [Desulfitobacteriaceae bacterium]
MAWFVLSILGILASATWLSREEAVQADKSDPSDGADGVSADGVSADGVSVNGAEVRIKGLEELLDSGFAAKQAGQFALAAQCFEEALKLSPEPDLVISLLADIYWLWKAVRGEEMARVQLQVLWDQHKGMPGGAENFISYLGG